MAKRRKNHLLNLVYILYVVFFLPTVVTGALGPLESVIDLLRIGSVILAIYLLFRMGKPSKALLFLSIYVALSAFVTGLRTFSASNLIRWIAIYLDIFTVAVFTEYLLRRDSNKYLVVMETVLGIGMLLNVASVLFFPDGLTRVANEAGVYFPYYFYDYDNHFLIKYVPMLAVIYINDESRAVKRTFLALILCLLSVIVTGSVTSIVALLLVLIGYMCIKMIPATLLNIRKVWIVYVCVSALIILFTSNDFLMSIITSVGKAASFGKRTSMWATAMEMVKDHLFLGTGVLDTLEMRYYFGFATLHNTLLNILLWSGVAGFALYSLMVVNMSREMDKSGAADTSKFYALLFGSIMVLCLMDCIELQPHIYSFYIIAANYRLIKEGLENTTAKQKFRRRIRFTWHG